MISDITPYRRDKNIGLAYNERIECLPDDAWIIIRDPDTMYLTPDYGRIIEETIESFGDDFGLFTAVTNRLGELSLCLNNEFSENTDVAYHYQKALQQTSNGEIKSVKLAAGFFMMFKKTTWEKVGKFKEKTVLADRDFSAKILKSGLKIGQIQALYIFHGYRIWQKSHKKAWSDVSHLK
jgi:GT2 family glycosyltransferase